MICPTFEQWEVSFLREIAPEMEIAVWEVIADAYDAYKAEKPDADKESLGMLIAISMGGGPIHETAESRRLRALFQQFWEQHAYLSADKTVTVTVVGVTDCHGLESITLKSTSLGALFYQLRAQSNRQRHALAYMAEISMNHVEIIDKLIADGQKDEALSALKEHAVEIRLAESEGVVESWEKIPNDSLDPWNERRIFKMIQRNRTVKMITAMKRSDGNFIPIDGYRRYRALAELGLGEDDGINAYCVEDDRSDERWQKFNTVVKQIEPPDREESLGE
jgi:hypothetical protein